MSPTAGSHHTAPTIIAWPVAQMDFSSSTMKKMILDGECRSRNTPNGRSKLAAPSPTKAEWKVLYDVVAVSGLHPAILSTHPDYSDMFVPVIRACNSSNFRLICDCPAKNLDYKDLMQLCERSLTASSSRNKPVRAFRPGRGVRH
ncbi:uncharacterized protein LOC142775953 [Rhipicephalus microplus]|uniref:uncharacterized protein LOC142775953 n=1 Tax=Rhipicephalus microplus TaxID=6941 RepID=UPI003F6D2D98